MSKLSDALAAMDKATPGQWIPELCLRGGYVIDNNLPEAAGKVRNIAEVSWHTNNKANATIIAAAPDALAWIKEALPWLEQHSDDLQSVIDTWRPGRSLEARDAFIKMRDEINALIAQVKPEEVGR